MPVAARSYPKLSSNAVFNITFVTDRFAEIPSTREPETVKPPVVKDKSRKHARTVAAITVSFIY